MPPDSYYNPSALNPHTTAKADDVNREFEKIREAFNLLPEAATIPVGSEGTPRYIHIAFADSADGTANFTTGNQGARAYMGLQNNSTSDTPSAFPENYLWARIRGADGSDGEPGTDGDPGGSGTSGEYTEDRYIRSLALPAAPTGNAPAGSSLAPPTGTNPLWKTTARRSGEGVLVTAWSPWERISAYPPPSEYGSTETYYEGMQVLYNGGTYVCIVESVSASAPSGTAQANAYWAVIAAPGEAGEPATPPSSFSATIDLTTSAVGVNLRSLADAAGYTGHSDATITFRVPNGVTIYGNANGGKGIDTGTWPVDSYVISLTVQVMNGGIVAGGGGGGGLGGSSFDGFAGTRGGDAIFQRLDLIEVIVDSGGIIRGGGGGGAGGEANRGLSGGEVYGSAGGGGGGGMPNGPAGPPGSTFTTNTPATAGQAGTAGAAGAGGAGLNEGGIAGTAGGNGGAYATAGQSSGSAPGGGAGHAIKRNGFTSPLTNNGTVTGVVG